MKCTLVFCIWLISPCISFLRFINIVYILVVFFNCWISSIYQLLDILDSSCSRPIINNNTMDITYSVCTCALISLGPVARTGIARPFGRFNSIRNSQLSSKVVTPLCISNNNARGVALTPRQHMAHLHFRCSKCRQRYQIVVLIFTSLITSDAEHLFMCPWIINVSFFVCEMPNLLPILKLPCLFPNYHAMEFLKYSGFEFFVR